MDELTAEQREMYACCLKPSLCTEAHYHERDIARMITEERERIARVIESLAWTMVSTADDEGTALTAAILQRAADVARSVAR